MTVSNNFELFTSILVALFAFLKWYAGIGIKRNSLKTQNIEIFNKLQYDSEEAKLNLIRSEIFAAITGQSACIHHINLIFNTYDPSRLLAIYRRAPGFVGFSDTDVIMPKRLENRISRWVMLASLVVLLLTPIIYIYMEREMPARSKYPVINLLFFLLMLPVSWYAIKEFNFLFKVQDYYKDKSIYGKK